MIYTLLSSICIAVFMLGVLYVAFEVFFRKREERIEFLRKFKRGQFAYIYVAAVPIYFMGYVYSGMKVLNAVFAAVSKFLGVIALQFDFSKIDLLMEHNPVYAAAVYICFALVVLNAMVLTFSLFHQAIWSARNRMRWVSKDADKCLIIGNNQHSLDIYSSEDDKYSYTEEEKKNKELKRAKKKLIKSRPLLAVSDVFSEDDKKALFMKGYTYVSETGSRKVIERVRRYVYKDMMVDEPERKSSYSLEFERFLCEAVSKNKNKEKKHRYTVIINTENEDRNIALCRQLTSFVTRYIDGLSLSENEKTAEKERKRAIIDLFSNLSVYVFGDSAYEAVYSEIIDAARGCLHYVDKYRQLAIDFVDKHPFTQYMGREHIDTERSVVREGVDINVCFIGFGKTGRQLFLTSVANNQFMQEWGSVYSLKPVKYYIFDKKHAENDKNLNHSYYRYRNEFFSKDTVDRLKEDPVLSYPYDIALFDKDVVTDKDGEPRFLTLPQLPAEEYYHELDINDTAFYNKIRSIVTRSKNDANFIVIAFGTDLENLDFAKKLIDKKQEWGATGLRIFVKVRGSDSSSEIFSREENDCFLIGDEKNTVYNLDRITDSALWGMTLMRHKVYSLEYDLTHGYASAESEADIAASLENAEYNWYVQRTELERNSNLYGVLSLRSKLHLMGLDYVKSESKDNGEFLSPEAYMERYAKDDAPTEKYGIKADGKTIYKYPLNFEPSRRTTMAMQEHYRWNSYMLSCGIVPATKESIAAEARHGKDYRLRRHGNLTTFDGLIEYRKLVADYDMKKQKGDKTYTDFLLEADVIKYDYQLLDDAAWLLERNGYKITERT